MEMEFARRFTGKKNSFQYERLCTKIRVETEVGATLKWLILKSVKIALNRTETHFLQFAIFQSN